MEDRISRLETTLQELEKRLEGIEARLSRLEPAGRDRLYEQFPAPAVSENIPMAEGQSATGVHLGWTWILSLIGRTLIVLGGGFLLRAVTDAGILTRPMGTACGILYGLFWFWLADRTAVKEKDHDALFHGVAGLLIVFPLLLEATGKYRFLPPVAGVVGLTAAAIIALAVAWHRRLRLLAYITTLVAVCSLVVLAQKPGTLITFAFSVNLLGLTTLWITYSRHWLGLASLTAMGVNAVILVLTILVIAVPDPETRFGLSPLMVLVVQFSAVLVYLGSIATRTLARHRDVILFEIIQSVILLVLWLGGAFLLAPLASVDLTPLGLMCLLLAAGCYGTAFSVIDRRVGGKVNFIFYTTMAIVFALFGGGVLLGSSTVSLVFVFMALMTLWFSHRYSRVTLFGHSVFYILAASLGSGLLTAGTETFFLSNFDIGPWTAIPVLVVIATIVIMSGAPVITHRRTWGPLVHLPRALLFLLLVYSMNGFLIAILIGLVPGTEVANPDRAMTAAIRTVVLTGSAVVLAWGCRSSRFTVASWLPFLVLLAGALKLVVEDLPDGRPATLFVSLAVYGGGLFLVPRLVRRSGT